MDLFRLMSDEFVSPARLLLGREEVAFNQAEHAGHTALIYAAKNGHDRVVGLLLGKCAIEVNAAEMWGSTALIWAVRNGHEKVVQQLLATKVSSISK